MQRQKIFLIAGVILAIAVAFMVKGYLDQQRAVIVAQAKQAVAQIQANQSAVLVAKRDLPKGTVLDPSMLETAIIPNEYVQPQAVSTLDRISGMVVVAPFSKNEQISLSKLSSQQQSTMGGSLAMATPIGKRAITVSVDNVSSLLGMIKPGDYVDVIGLLPVPVQTSEGKTATQTEVLPLFQNVLILAVGQNTGAPAAPAGDARYKKEGGAPAGDISPYITIALGPQEASLIAFVLEQGKIRLTLRSPADSQVQPIQPAGWDTLFRHVTPQTQGASGEEEAKKAEVDTGGYSIDIYRGLSKEKISVK